MRIAVIPARGGSKRISRKNIKPFCGKPMIAWSIEAARLSGCFDRIIVSTEDAEIAEVAHAHGAEVPFMRPLELSDDHTGTIPVIAHAIDWMNRNIGPVDFACCVYATAPFVQAEDLCRGFDVLQQSGADYAFSVTSYAFPIQRAIRITADKRVEMFNPEHFNTRSQDLEEAFHDAGQFYWGHTAAWLAGKPLFSQDAAPVMLPRHRVQDIDTPEDWERAEWLFKVMSSEKEKGVMRIVAGDMKMQKNILDIDPDCPVYRILDRGRFIEILENKQITLTHPSKWDDPHENSLLSAEIIYGEERVSLDVLRSQMFGQSWSLCSESDSLWRIYSPNKSGVRIKSTPRKLLAAMNAWDRHNHPELNCFVGLVKYKSPDELWADFNSASDFLTSNGIGLAKIFLIKRDAFKHETEVRVIYANGPKQLFLNLDIDPNSLIDEVTLDPRGSDLDLLTLRNQARQLQYTGTVNRSNLYLPPAPITMPID